MEFDTPHGSPVMERSMRSGQMTAHSRASMTRGGSRMSEKMLHENPVPCSPDDLTSRTPFKEGQSNSSNTRVLVERWFKF